MSPNENRLNFIHSALSENLTVARETAAALLREIESRFEGLRQVNEDALLADGFEDAYLGYVGNGIAVYSRSKCIKILMTPNSMSNDGMSYEAAVEFFDFNVEGAYVGPNTPLFLTEPE